MRIAGDVSWSVAVAVVLTTLAATACTADDDGAIETGLVGRETVVEVVEAPAAVTAKASATVTAAADGQVGELLVADGQQVSAGTVLLRIASPQAQQQLTQAQEADASAAASADVELGAIPVSTQAARTDQRATAAFATARDAAQAIPDPAARAQALAALATAEADYAAARSDADRAIRQLNAGLGSLSDALSSLGAAQRVQTQAAVDAAQATVDALEVRAPVGGIVTLGAAGAGGGTGTSVPGLPPALADAAEDVLEDAAAGSTSAAPAVSTLAVGSPVSRGQVVATVTDVSALGMAAEVDETDVLLVQPGVVGTAELDALPGATYGVAVSSVDVAPTTSASGGVSYRVRLALSAGRTADGDTAPAPLPGMSAVVDLLVREATDALSVPASAVVRDGARDSVWLVVDDVVRRQHVRLGAQGESSVEIVQGVSEGDRIVVRGADRVRDGQSLGG